MKVTISSVMHPPENFYHLIPREEVKSEKAPRYMSQFREQVKQEQKLNKASHRTMGPAKVEVSSPDKFLKKHSNEPKLPEKKPFSYREVRPRKPSIPAKTEQLLAGGHAQRDFVRRNAVENIKAVPCKPKPASIHTRHGDKELLENSGLVPKYIKRKDYGKVPEYLKQRQEELRRAQEEYDRYVKKKRKGEDMKQLSEEERQDILHGLKKNWDELNHQYQGLSLFMDIISKKHRKERLESEMKQLEKDIELIKRHKIIYITKN